MKVIQRLPFLLLAAGLCACAKKSPPAADEHSPRHVSIDKIRLGKEFAKQSEEEILISLFGNFDTKERSSFVRRENVPIPKNSFLSGEEFQFLRATLHATKIQKIKGQTYLMTIVSLIPDGVLYDCHPCSVLPLAARFRRANGRWFPVDRHFMQMSGGRGNMPSVEFSMLSPAMPGIIIHEGDLHMGIMMEWLVIYAYYNAQLTLAAKVPLAGSNEGDCDPKAHNCYSYNNSIEWVKTASPYHIRTRCTGSTHGFPLTPRKCPGIEDYRFVDGTYIVGRKGTSPN